MQLRGTQLRNIVDLMYCFVTAGCIRQLFANMLGISTSEDENMSVLHLQPPNCKKKKKEREINNVTVEATKGFPTGSIQRLAKVFTPP